MNRIIVIGGNGSGKSTFAKKLHSSTGLPLVHLDRLLWYGDWQVRERAEFDALLGAELEKDRWIIDGNYNRTIERRMAACDTVFVLDYPVEVCLAGAAARVGQVREEMPWTDTELRPDLAQYIRDFPSTQLPHVYELAAQYAQGRRIVVLHSRDEADAWLRLYETGKA